MAKLIIGMGLPGAGKSTTLKSFAAKYGYEFISVDQIREMNGLTPDKPSTEREWDEIRENTLRLFQEGKTVVIDGTFLGDIRKKFIQFARENGISKIQGLLIDTPSELAWERNQSREKHTTRELFDDRLWNLKHLPPEITDGFDSLFVLNENSELTEAKVGNELRSEVRSKRKFL